MESRRNLIKNAYYRSGFNSTLSLVSGLRGPLNFRYEGWKRILYMCYAFTVDLSITFNTLIVILRGFVHKMSLVELCFWGFPAMTCGLAMFRTVYYNRNRKRFEDFLLDYEACFPDDEFKAEMNEEVHRYSKVFRPVSIMMPLSTFVAMVPWCSLPLINYILGKPKKLSVPAWFLADPEENDLVFKFLAVSEIFGGCYIPWRIVAFDDIFYCYSARQLALFHHIEKNLDRLLERYYPSSGGGRPLGKQAEKDFIKWAKHHRETLRLMDELQNIFSPCLLVYFTLLSLSMCTNAFVVTVETDLARIIFCATFVGGNVTSLLFTCRVGDLIKHRSSSLNNAFLGKFTSISTKSEYKILKIIMTRCQVSSTLSAIGVFPLDSDSFQSIMLSTYSYYTMLRELRSK